METTQTSQRPLCRCGRFLREPAEIERGYCSRCPAPSQLKRIDEEEEEIFCCQSDPPCPSCPFVIGW